MNKKGFTLIEIIGAIIILGIISLIAFNAYTSSMKGFREDYYTDLSRTVRESGKEFFNDNRKYRPNSILEAQKITVNGLMTEKYVGSVVDYNGDSCDINTSYVIVVKEGRDKYTYHSCLICSEDEFNNTSDKYCDSSWTDPTRIRYGLGGETVDTIYIYKGANKDELRDLLELEISYERLNYQDEVIASAKGDGKDNLPTIFPVDMDIVDTNKVGTYTVTYEYSPLRSNGAVASKEKATRNVVVYEASAPGINITYENKESDASFRLGNLPIYNKNGDDTNVKTKTGVYTSGMWAQRITVSISGNAIEIPDPDVKISRYQWNKDGIWQDFCVTENNCTKEILTDMNEEIKFRMVASNGNISKETNPITIRRDYSPPSCSLLVSGRKGTGSVSDWYIGDVSIAFAAKAEGSGGSEVAKSGIKVSNIYISTHAVDRMNSNEGTTHTTDGTGITYVGYVEDNAGNFVTCRNTFKRDTTGPTCELKVDSGTKNSAGTYITDVVLSFNTSKNDDHGGSGVSNYSFPTGEQTYTHDGDSTDAVTVTGYITDAIGNEGSCSLSFKKDSRITVTYDSDGGSTCDPKTVYYENEYGTLCNPSKTDKRFDGWYTAKTGGSHVTADTIVTEKENHTLYARWVNNDTGYTITTSTCKGASSTCYSFKNIKFEQGLTSCSPQSSQCLGKTYLGNIQITCNKVANGTYQKRTNKCQQVSCGGYEFVNTISGGAECQVGSVFTCDGNHVGNYYISACSANQYTITLNGNGATGAGTASKKINYHSTKLGTITLPSRQYTVSFNRHSASATTTALTSTYSLDGWYDAASGGTKIAGNTTDGLFVANISGFTDSSKRWIKPANTTLFAHWTGGGVTLPAVSLTGHTCAWYTAETGGTKVGNNGGGGTYYPTANITLHARCTANQYTVTLNGNGATTAGTASTIATYNSTTLGSISNPQRGYTVSFNLNGTGATATTTSLTATSTFNGWYTAASGGSKVASNATTPALQASISGYTDASSRWIKTGNATVYAQWTARSVTLPAISKSNHTCNWNTNSSGSGASYNGGASFTPSGNITLYAKCTANSSGGGAHCPYVCVSGCPSGYAGRRDGGCPSSKPYTCCN